MSTRHLVRISRRTTLQWLAGVMAASGIVDTFASDTPRTGKHDSAAPAKGYGTDPDLINPKVTLARTMTMHQLQLTTVLADIILPGIDTAAMPSNLGIADFVDEWVSAPYSDQQADRTIIVAGLQWVDVEANKHWQREFLEISPEQQRQIVDSIVPKRNESATVQGTFFRRLRAIVASAYYTTPEGFKAIGYIGNVPLDHYPSITDQERAILDAELRNLGI